MRAGGGSRCREWNGTSNLGFASDPPFVNAVDHSVHGSFRLSIRLTGCSDQLRQMGDNPLYLLVEFILLEMGLGAVFDTCISISRFWKTERSVNPPRKSCRFPAKSYGWGWSLPNCWQRWIVLIAYVAVAGAALPCFVPPCANPSLFFGMLVITMLLLIVVRFVKGEPPRCRWGEPPESN
jgi:hypothetical protein